MGLSICLIQICLIIKHREQNRHAKGLSHHLVHLTKLYMNHMRQFNSSKFHFQFESNQQQSMKMAITILVGVKADANVFAFQR